MFAKVKYFVSLILLFLVLIFVAKTLYKWPMSFKTKKDSELAVLAEQKVHLKRILKSGRCSTAVNSP